MDKNQQPSVAIVLVCYNCLGDIKKCLDSLLAMDYPDFTIVAVDNASGDGTPDEIERSYPQVVLLKNKNNIGCGPGNNQGMAYAREHGFDFIWLLNTDVVVERETLSRLVRAFEEQPDLMLGHPVLYYLNTPEKMQYCGSGIDWRRYLKYHLQSIEQAQSIDQKDFWLWGTALLLRRQVIETIGYYEDKYFLYCEDLELCMRAHAAVFRYAIIPEAKLYHRSHEIDTRGRGNLPLHWFFYVTRNEFWFWRDYTRGLKKISFFRVYLARILDQVGHWREEGQDKIIDAHLDGLYCAWRGKTGKWDPSIKMPGWMRKIFVACPFVFSDLLNGKFGAVFNRLTHRTTHQRG